MTISFFKEFLGFFKKFLLNGLSNKSHLSILDGHGFHGTLKAIDNAHAFELNMVTLPSHMSHTPQLLYLSYFKPFKTTFKFFFF